MSKTDSAKYDLSRRSIMSYLSLAGAATVVAAVANSAPAQAVEATPSAARTTYSEGAIADATDVGGTDNGAFRNGQSMRSLRIGRNHAHQSGAFHKVCQIPQQRKSSPSARQLSTQPAAGIRLCRWSGTATGYGSSVKNISIEGLTFRGRFTATKTLG
jgi:hypothetical protein